MSRLSRHIAFRPLLAVALLAGTAGCSARAAESGAEYGSTTTTRAARRSPDVITAEEIASINASNALHAIELLRPTFLRSRGSASVGSGLTPVVYVNGQRGGDVGTLRSLPANDIQTVRRMSAAEAQSRYGLDNAGGVIDVTTKTGGRS